MHLIRRGWRWLLANRDRWIFLVLGLAFAIRAAVLVRYRLSLTLNSDDVGYMHSAIWLLQYGRFTYHAPDEPTAHMMPGITLLLAAVFAVFGWGPWGVMIAKGVMTLFGVAAVYGVYLCGREAFGVFAGLIAALGAAIYVPGVLTDTLLLTEPPFAAAFAFLMYFTLRLVRTRQTRDLLAAVGCYLVALYFRPTVALFPLVILIYLLSHRYPWRKLVRHAGLGAVVVCLLLAPWWVRNEVTFHRFVPLTNGQGDPLLLGTFQGEGFPPGTYQDTLNAIKAAHPGVDAFHLSTLEKQAAEQRLKTWWREDRSAFLRSFLSIKPQILWNRPFYWKPILRVKQDTMRWVQPILIQLGCIGWAVALILGRRRRETLFFILTLVYYTALYAAYFAYGRYSEPFMPYLFLGVGAGLAAVAHTAWRLYRAALRRRFNG
ncbi:glycosyltransferase family 39 protein [Alicyclobacillus sp.]|uniref:ArnT family glycosyltransferase n=1 Tax=Alicyclobacillus sp. TaxID=61169 RepID=UPI0025BD0B28|nr:glycosyltransferase family 39 protein [Alicyclobacillus sp.]MCL6515987.1 glycosyltransferase family 39 protein [Alicyclobacillus sp.]